MLIYAPNCAKSRGALQLRFSSNAYVPISGWRDSRDFDRRFRETHPGKRMEERPARGWDAHVEAALPFYPGLAFTGGLTQWYGDKVDALGHGTLEKDPRVWDYGVKYTPFPLFTASVTQRNTEGGRQDTVVGLSLTYRFGMPWSQQINPARVKDLATVSGARYEFVKRENRMPLARRERRVEGGGGSSEGGSELTLAFTVNSNHAKSFGFAMPASTTNAERPSNYWALAEIQASSTDPKIQDAINNNKVRWEVVSSTITLSDIFDNGVLASGYNGLTWGATPLLVNSRQSNQQNMNGLSPTSGDTAQLTDIIGSRTVIVKATIDGMPGVESDPLEVRFGAGPLSVLRIPGGGSVPFAGWADEGNISYSTSLPAAELCVKTSVSVDIIQSWAIDSFPADHIDVTGLPSHEELQNVASGSSGKQGAAFAAGWPYDYFWTGELNNAGNANAVYLGPGWATGRGVHVMSPVVCRREPA
jgi:hypothetical protein